MLRSRSSPLHVLVIPSWYHSDYEPGRGMFFADHARAVQTAGVQVGVLFPDLKRLRAGHWRDAAGRRFQSLCADEDGLATARCLGWKIVPSTWRDGLLDSAFWVACGERAVEAYIRARGRPDLLHAHVTIAAGGLAARLSRRWALPWLLTEHSSEWLLTDIPLRRVAYATGVAASASEVIGVSRAMLAGLRTWGVLPSGRGVVIPNTIDTDYFTLPRSVRAEATRFIAVGAVNRRIKGVDVLLAAFAAAARCCDCTLDIVGDGPERVALTAEAARLHIADRVVWHGHVARGEVRRLLWNASVLVHAANHETFGVAVAEGLATGLPAVCTSCGGVEDIITPDLQALGCQLVPVGDVGALAKAMLRAAEARRCAELEQRIRASVCARFGMREIGLQTRALYERIVGLPGAKP